MAGKCSKSAVFKYFKEVEGTLELICRVKNKDGSTCNVRMSAKTSNLKRHLERQHKEVFKWVKEQAMPEVHKKDSPTTSNRQSSLSQYFSNKKVSISMTKEQLKRQISKLVVDDGVALQLFSSPAFLGLMGELGTKHEF